MYVDLWLKLIMKSDKQQDEGRPRTRQSCLITSLPDEVNKVFCRETDCESYQAGDAYAHLPPTVVGCRHRRQRHLGGLRPSP